MDHAVDKLAYLLQLLLEAGTEFARTVLKQNDKAEGEEHEQHQPEKTADQTHAAHVNLLPSDGQRSTQRDGVDRKRGQSWPVIRQQRALMLR